MAPPKLSRRQFLLAGGGAIAALAGTTWAGSRLLLRNPCRAALPTALAASQAIAAAWQGLDASQVWDCHTHLAGIGDSDSGIVVGPQLQSPLHPLTYAQRLFYMNAGCVHDAPGRVDVSYVDRLRNLCDGMPAGFKTLLFAFERFYDAQGRPVAAASTLHVPNAYARDVARSTPQGFEWVASIHPWRGDALAALDQAVSEGARAVKWLPAAMGMDPAAASCDAFYRALARHDLPLIVHCGEEQAVRGGDSQAFGNPLRLRRALDQGVRIVVAHCASLGHDVDLDAGAHGPQRSSFALFARLMNEARAKDRLYADLSAITQRNRPTALLRTLLERDDWQPRLLNGSDYPLPGILPLIGLDRLVGDGLLDIEAVADLSLIREHNPLLFDFTLKRHLRWQGRRLPSTVFATRSFFERPVA